MTDVKEQISNDDSGNRSIIHINPQHDLGALIESLQADNQSKVVQLVIPQDSHVLQSISALKLVKQVCTQNQQELVLITTNPSIINLSHYLKIKLARNLGEPGEIPEQINLDDSGQDSQPKAGRDVLKSKKKDFVVETVDQLPVEKSNSKSRKGISMNHKIVLISIIFALLVTSVILLVNMQASRVTLTIQMTPDTIATDIEVELSRSISRVDIENSRAPLKLVNLQEDVEYNFEAKGLKMIGDKAVDHIDINNCNQGGSLTINSNTIFVRANDSSLQFKPDSLTKTLTLNSRSVSPQNEDYCVREAVKVQAVEIGEEYNSQDTSDRYRILGANSEYSALGRGSKGGSKKEVTFISRKDVENAKEALANKIDTATARRTLESNFSGDYRIFGNTFLMETGDIVKDFDDSNEDDFYANNELQAGTISQSITYSIAGVLNSDLDKIIDPKLQELAGGQEVIDRGLATAEFRLDDRDIRDRDQDSEYDLLIVIDQAKAGVDLNVDQIKQDIKGKSLKAAASELRRIEGVDTVQTNVDPFWAIWINKIPNDLNKIVVNINQDGNE